MTCPKCQFDNRDGVKFCEDCGAKMELDCPKCGAKIPFGRKFCGECGHDLGEPKEDPPIDYDQPQSYTPKFLADKILTTRSSIEGERKLVTVLFADVANYTSIAEKLDPEEVHQIMDGCFKILMEEIHRYEGTINQFTGDGVMALFGAPVAHEDHAQRACYAALAIQNALAKYSEELKRKFGFSFKMRVGLNSGSVVVGSIGDDLRMDYTAVGDTTNLAARIESMARPGTILVTDYTHKLIADFFEFELPGKVEVKGREELVEAYELIKAGEAETRIEAAVTKGLTKFVGRKNSMAALMEAYEKAKSGSGQVVGMVGEAGVGKSRVLLEFRNRMPRDEFIYLEGRCFHYGGTIPYLPVLDILRSYLEIKEEDQESIIKKKMKEKIQDLDEKLKAVIPPFQQLLSLKVDDEGFIKLEPKEKRERTFEANRDLIIRVSQEKPLVIAFEDLHWMDKTSEEFLDYLVGWLANSHILLILLYRPEYTHQWGSRSYYTKIGLDELGTISSSELVKAILEEGEVAPELRQLLLNRAAGNPLFMEEFTHTLLEYGSIEKKDKKFVLSGKASDIQVPDTIQGIIAARLDRLEDNLKRTMQVASVIGREFAFRVLQTITGMKEELKSYLLNLQGLEFIYEKSLFPELEYTFKHTLTQEVAYNSLLFKRRKEIHEKIGEAIEELYPDGLQEFSERLAHHYSNSDNFEKAYHYIKTSLEKAMRSYSNLEAFRFGKEAIKVLNRLPDTRENRREQIHIRLLVSKCMYPLAYPEDSIKILQEGERLAKDVGDEISIANFHRFIGSYYGIKGNPLLAIKYQKDCLEEAKKAQDFELALQAMTELCISYGRVGEPSKLTGAAESALDLIKTTKGDLELAGMAAARYSRLCSAYGVGLGMLGSFEEGKTYLEKSLQIGIKIGDIENLAACEIHYGYFYLYKGNWNHAVEHFQRSIDYAEETRWVWAQIWAWSFMGYAYCMLGKLEAARKYAEKGLCTQKYAGPEVYASLHYWVSSLVHLELGKHREARGYVEKALELSRRNNERHFEGLSWISFGRILVKTDLSQSDKAQDCILKGIKILNESKVRPLSSQGYLFLGELYADTGQKEKALENLKKVEGMFQEMGMDYWLAKTQEVLERL